MREQGDKAPEQDELMYLSHELRTPMNGILGLCELLQKQLPSEGEAKELVGIIARSASRMVNLVSDVLDQGKLQSGKMYAERDPFDLKRLLQDCLQLFTPNIDATRVRIVLDYSAAVPSLVIGDEKKVAQILGNLLSNAAKFTRQGEIILRVLSEAYGKDQITIRFEVHDSGPGIAPEEMAKVFAAFEQTQSSRLSLARSSGLGLYLSKQLVELLGGTIAVESQSGLGTTFRLLVPFGLCRDLAKPGISARIMAKQIPTLLSQERGRILLVDDDPINLELVRRQLQTLNAEVICLRQPTVALEILQTQSFDMVLLDYHLPEMTGAELLNLWREGMRLSRATPVIALTALSAARSVDVRQQLLAEGFDDYLAKPAGLEQMAKIVGRWIPLSRLTQKLLRQAR